MGAAAKTPLTRYQKTLFVFLSVATFFEGYDFLALTQILPNLRADLDLSIADAGFVVAIINFGTVVAYLLVRKADTWGRKQTLTLTIVGYTLFTFMTGLSWDVYSFTAFQFAARIFLIAEWATAMVYAAEEFPADRRGMVIGVIGAFSSLGAILCAGLVPLLLEVPIADPFGDGDLGWRAVYFVGIIPLVLLAFARRNLRETERFSNRADKGAHRPFFAILSSPYRNRMLMMAAIWMAAYLCSHNAVTFWKDFATTERGFTDGDVGRSVTMAALVSMPLVFAVGPMIDRIGRRPGAFIVLLMGAAGCYFGYTLHGWWPLTIALVFAIFGASGALPVLNSFTAELFPTELRADAFAWSNNLLGRIGYVLSPIALASLADTHGWGPVVSLAAIGNLIAIALVFALLPETRGRELEETSAL